MGKQVDAKSVVGRDSLIDRIWVQLQKPPEQGSIRFTAERRIGKTTVMTKMKEEPREPFDVLFMEVEGVDSCEALVELLLNRIKPLLTGAQKARDWFNGFCETIGGTEIGGVLKLPTIGKLGWQPTLEKSIEGLCQNRTDRLVLLMFDELPYMLQKIEQVSSKTDRPHQALTLLDTLRALRQRHANLRMIFAGSVGLHHVLRDLKKAGLAAEPVNNMPFIEINPLEKCHAMELAKRLLTAERVSCADDDLESIAKRMASLTDNVPFYLERISGQLGVLQHEIALQDVDRIVQHQMVDDHDPWEMEHFRERLDTYYHESVHDTSGQQITRATIARSILDHLALAEEPQSINQVWTFLRSQFAVTDRNIAVALLKSLAQDHYLTCDAEKRYSFRFPLIKRWWTLAQGLDG